MPATSAIWMATSSMSSASVEDSTLIAADGTRLRRQLWRCAVPPTLAVARGSVLIVHGLGEHIGRYYWLATQLAAAGWNVVGADLRGHGRSGGARGSLRGAGVGNAPHDDALLTDLAQVIDSVRAELPAPLVLLGHSLGGLVASRFVAEGLAAVPAPWWRPLQALVLSSPALDTGLGAWQRLQLRLMSALAPDVAVGNGLNPDLVSRDPAVVAAYRADALVHDRITARLVRFIVTAGAQVQAAAPRWALPTLLLYAGTDRLVRAAGSAAFAAAAPANAVQAQCFPALFHEVFNEPERDQVLAALQAWLDRLGA